MEKMLLKSTTRHVRIFTAEVVENELVFHPNKLTLDLDPDNEFIWNEDSLNFSFILDKESSFQINSLSGSKSRVNLLG